MSRNHFLNDYLLNKNDCYLISNKNQVRNKQQKKLEITLNKDLYEIFKNEN